MTGPDRPELLGHQQRTTIMGYGNERMPWHPRKAARTASMHWRDAGYGSLTVLTLLLAVTVVIELRRSLGRWLASTSNENSSR